jgi:sulfur carrier protein
MPQPDASPDRPHLTVNGEPVAFAGGPLADLMAQLGMAGRSGLAVAVNDRVVPRSRWAEQDLAPTDRVTVITATAGG